MSEKRRRRRRNPPDVCKNGGNRTEAEADDVRGRGRGYRDTEDTEKRLPEKKSGPDSVVRDVLASKGGDDPAFDMARRLVGLGVSGNEIRPYAEKLHAALGRDGDYEDTFEDLQYAVNRVWLSVNGQVDYLPSAALKVADTLCLPELPGKYTKRMKRLAAWGCVLGRWNGARPFFLSVRLVESLLGVSRWKAGRLLNLLIDDELFEVVWVGKGGRASRFRYHGPNPGEIEEPPEGVA